MATPKIFLVRDGERFKISLTSPDPDAALVEGACPHCARTPFMVQGTGRRIAQDDRAYEADGVCTGCSKFVGIIRAEVNTLFGIREDEAVLGGRCRVY